MSLVPALVIVLGLVSAFAVGGYWLMKPTVVSNPGVAAYKAPAGAKVLDAGYETKQIAAERAANAVADRENRKLGLAANASAVADRPAVVAATPRQATARVQRRPDAPGQNQPRVAQREQPAQSFFGQWRLF
jgi:hypothetical protein